MSSDIADKLSQETSQLVSEFEKRLDAFTQRDDLIGLTQRLDSLDGSSLAREFFGEGEHIATGVDGSREYDERLQMMLFYSNATAYSCPFTVGEDVTFKLQDSRRDAKFSATSAIPLWMEDVTSVMPDLPESEAELEHSIERIPNAFMTLGELYLATKAIDNGSRILFLDRPISGTYSTLSRDYALLLKSKASYLTELEFAGSRVSSLDLRLGLSLGAPWMTVPHRPRFLKYSVLRVLLNSDASPSQIASTLRIEVRGMERAVAGLRKLDDQFNGALLSNSGSGTLKLREEVRGYWQRLSSLAINYAKSVFEVGGHPLLLPSGHWLTVLDVNAVSLLLLEYLCEIAQRSGALLIGIAKDTTATDISRAALPFAIERGYIEPRSPVPRINNDKAFLSILSSTNLSIKTPWRTFGYDACFSTIRWSSERSPNFVAARKVVSREGLFIRGFFQLRTLRTDPHLRSPVFFFDRIFDGRYDDGAGRRPDEEDEGKETVLKVAEKEGLTEIRPYFEPIRGHGGLSNLALYILSLADNPEVSEAFGHNQLLYLADKAVKMEVRMMRSSLRGVADLRVGRMSRRGQVSGVESTFREQRLEAEEARARGARASYGE